MIPGHSLEPTESERMETHFNMTKSQAEHFPQYQSCDTVAECFATLRMNMSLINNDQ